MGLSIDRFEHPVPLKAYKELDGLSFNLYGILSFKYKLVCMDVKPMALLFGPHNGHFYQNCGSFMENYIMQIFIVE